MSAVVTVRDRRSPHTSVAFRGQPRLTACTAQVSMSTRTMLFVALTLATTAGCHAASERSAGGAAAAAAQKASEAARELEHSPVRASEHSVDDLHEASEEVRREREDVAEAAARERVQYKRILAKEISSVDKRVTELEQELARATGAAKDTKALDVSAARGWRARLKHDLEELERVGEHEWPEVKDRIDRDLEDERPPAVPRSFEKSYAI